MNLPRHAGLLAAALALALLPGCSGRGDRSNVVAFSNTSIGVTGGMPPGATSPDITIGYKRQEFAKVPTNRCDDACPGGPSPTSGCPTGCLAGRGARDSAEVLMELRGSAGLSTLFDGKIYQRLAVGEVAVRQPGAAFLMLKGMSASAQTSAAQAIEKSMENEGARIALEAKRTQLRIVSLPQVAAAHQALKAGVGTDAAKGKNAWEKVAAQFPVEAAATQADHPGLKPETSGKQLVMYFIEENPDKASAVEALL